MFCRVYSLFLLWLSTHPELFALQGSHLHYILIPRPLPIFHIRKSRKLPWDEAKSTLLWCMYNADLQQYVCETGVGIQVSDSLPPYCTTVCSVQEPHFIRVGLFQHIKAVRLFFNGKFSKESNFHSFHDWSTIHKLCLHIMAWLHTFMYMKKELNKIMKMICPWKLNSLKIFCYRVALYTYIDLI